VTQYAPLPSIRMRRSTTRASIRNGAGCMWVLIACSLSLACVGSAGPKDPQATIAAYAEALRRRDAPRAYGLLSVEAQKRLPFTRFEAMMRENPEQVAVLAKALAAGPKRMVVTATFASADDESIELTLEEGQWKANLSALDLYSQQDPLATLRSFVRAFDAQRYDVLIRFVPEAEVEGITPDKLKQAWEGPQRDDMSALIDGLKSSLPTAKAEQYGNRATVGYGSSGTVELLEENGLWKVVNF
jgi:hypothetical protein